MATQKRRVIYMSDEEWALLAAQAKEHKRTISNVIRDMWQIASRDDPADPEEHARVVTMATEKLGHDPYKTFRPAPKPGRK